MPSMMERSSSASFDPTCPFSAHAAKSFATRWFLSSSLSLSLPIAVLVMNSFVITDCSALRSGGSSKLERDVRVAGETAVKPLTSVVWAVDRRIMKDNTLPITMMTGVLLAIFAAAGNRRWVGIGTIEDTEFATQTPLPLPS